MRGKTAAVLSLLVIGLALGSAAQAEEVEPHVVHMEWNGFITCAASWPTGGVLPYSGISACALYDPTGQHAFLHEWTIESGLKSVVGAMVWESEASALAPDLRLLMERAGAANMAPRYAQVEGASPVTFRVDEGYVIENFEETYHEFDFSNVEESLDLMFRVFPGSELNVVLMQPFTIYWDLYYGEPAPEDATAVPGA